LLGTQSTETKNKRAGGMKILRATLTTAVTLACFSVLPVNAQTLNGSRAAMEAQHYHAVSQGYTFARTPSDVTTMIAGGELVRVSPTRSMTLHAISYPYLRPQAKTFIERLAVQYQNACGEKLVVTSMTRPSVRQPANAHDLSVHPVGMAIDLRIPANGRCRSWLESTLLSLEERDVLNVIRERRPPHYHVALFPEPYEAYLASLNGQSFDYVVVRGDTLSGIARRTGSSVAQIRAANSLRGDLINIGQRLQIPDGSSAVQTASNNNSSAAQVREVEYQVQPGDTLWHIANVYRTSVDTLRRVNGLADDLLRVGQMLRVMVEEG